MKTIREIAITAGTVAALVLLGLSAYLAVNSLMRMQRIAGLTRESSLIHSGISNVQKDLTDMETGQRGYLLTANDSYLQPYADAKARIAGDFAELRRGLASERSSSVPWSYRWNLWLTRNKPRWNVPSI